MLARRYCALPKRIRAGGAGGVGGVGGAIISIPNRDLNTTTVPPLDIVPRSREAHLLDSNENR